MNAPQAGALEWPVYGLAEADKSALLLEALNASTRHHRAGCVPYARVLEALGVRSGPAVRLADLPFLPVGLFKRQWLSSVAPDEVFKVLTSSGTTGQTPSRIVLDRATAADQTRALVRIGQAWLGKARLPMLVIDHDGVIRDRRSFSARGAAILGFSTFGRDMTYALRDEGMQPDLDAICAFAERHQGERVLLFGFTAVVWQSLCRSLAKEPRRPRFDGAVLVHGGGWKRMQDQAVDRATFRDTLRELFGIGEVHDYYGMVEQVGSIFMECEAGRFHAPAFADVLVRDAHSWEVLPAGRTGLIQVLSVLPRSYPGHSLLTEDEGAWLGVDDCPCGKLGRTFRVNGRVAMAELRGCSDTLVAGA